MEKHNIIFFGSDYLSLCLESLIKRDDIAIRSIFVLGGIGATRVKFLANRAGIRLISDPIDVDRHESIVNGANTILTAGYGRKVPPFNVDCAINLHPTLLPAGRGAWPIPWILFDQPQAAGVTLHILTSEFDAGPILASRPVRNATNLSFEAYAMICNQLGNGVVSRFFDDPGAHLRSAQPQDLVGWPILPRFPDHRRLITSDMSGMSIVSTIRKLGPLGALLDIGTLRIKLTGGEFIPDPGTRSQSAFFETNDLYSSLRCKDGFVLFKPSELHRS